jgi:hypothetical protein
MSSPNRNIFQKKCCDQILAAFANPARSRLSGGWLDFGLS